MCVAGHRVGPGVGDGDQRLVVQVLVSQSDGAQVRARRGASESIGDGAGAVVGMPDAVATVAGAGVAAGASLLLSTSGAQNQTATAASSASIPAFLGFFFKSRFS